MHWWETGAFLSQVSSRSEETPMARCAFWIRLRHVRWIVWCSVYQQIGADQEATMTPLYITSNIVMLEA